MFPNGNNFTENGYDVYSPPLGLMPRVAVTTISTAPVHIDVGGVIYTSSLETLTAFPESKIAKMFTGYIPIVLDTLKQHYFIDRDGGMFRHVLNFLRCRRLVLPENFAYLDLLLLEAIYYELEPMVEELVKLKNERAALLLGAQGGCWPQPSPDPLDVPLDPTDSLGDV